MIFKGMIFNKVNDIGLRGTFPNNCIRCATCKSIKNGILFHKYRAVYRSKNNERKSELPWIKWAKIKCARNTIKCASDILFCFEKRYNAIVTK